MGKKKLEDKVIVISGGTKGVGRAAAEAFAKEGAKVIIGGRDQAAASAIIRMIEVYGSEGKFVYTNLEKISDCKKMFDIAYEKYGHIDGFFNYAGVTPVSSLDVCDEATFDKVMDINFKSAFFCCQSAVRYMRENNGGSIVLTGSAHAWGGQKDRAAYACSKGVLLTLSEHIAHNYASEQIRCNYLTLGWTPTEGELSLRKQEGLTEDELRKMAAREIPIGRMSEVEDHVPAVLYLLSDLSQVVTGSNIRVTGGLFF